MTGSAAGGQTYAEGFLAGLAPDPRLTVSEWADRHRWLSSKTAESPGQWRTSRTPYLREIMDALSPSSPVQVVVFMKGAQLGGTEVGLNLVGFCIDQAPRPILDVQPTTQLAERYSRQRLEPLIDDSPRLRNKVRAARSRDSGNTILAKEFTGGIVVLTGANSAVGLRSMPAGTLILDEIDAFPPDVDGEGDPVKLAEARTRTFRRSRKVLKISTPLTQGSSRIEAAYNATDRRRYHVPCPHCGAFQVLQWDRVRWDKGKPKTARYLCAACDREIEEGRKTEMLERGRWVAENPEADPLSRGYHLSSLYSPVGWYSWSDAVAEFEETQPGGTTDPELLRAFVNTVLGETFVQRGEAPEWERIWERRERYRSGTVPARGLLLTAGVDVQADRLEATVVAWGRGRESWQVEHRAIPGDPEGAEVWKLLDSFLSERWPHEAGSELGLRLLAIDSGYATTAVYQWARRQSADRVMVCKGRGVFPAAVGQPSAVDVAATGKRLRRGVRVWPVGVGLVKSELYGWLRLPVPRAGEPAPGYCHFPELPEEFFRQLTAEELVAKVVRGFRRLEWQKLAGRRNEVLDCRVYARAATVLLGLDRWPESHWSKLEAALGLKVTPAPGQTVPAARPEPERGRTRSRFMDRWRPGQ